MEALLRKQNKLLEELLKANKADKKAQTSKIFQGMKGSDQRTVAAATEGVAQAEEDRMEVQLKDNNKILKEISDTNKQQLANSRKMFQELKKHTDVYRGLSRGEAKQITDKSLERRQYNTVKPRLHNFKENVKDFFSLRGFLDKTGVVERKSGGLISEYLDRREEKQKYIKNRMKVDPTARLHGEDKAKQIFAKQFDQQQNLQWEMRKNEKKISEMKDLGFTDKQIDRSDEGKKRLLLAEQMAKVDTRVRPEGFDPDTKLVKQKKKDKDNEGIVKAVKKDSLSSEESILEQNRMIEEQTGLLIKIEENTRGLSADKGKVKKDSAEEDSGGGGFGIGDLLGMGGGALKTAGRAIGKVGKAAVGGLAKAGGALVRTAGRFAGPLAAAASVAVSAYEGYSLYKDAKATQEKETEEVDQMKRDGKITKEQADEMKHKIDNKATVEKSGAVGTGVGGAAGGAGGAMAGAAIGATIGSAVPIIGTAVGGLIGAGIGGLAGTKAGQWIGDKVGRGFGHAANFAGDTFRSAKNWFGAKVDAVKDTYLRGNTGTKEAEEQDKIVRERALKAGAIDEKGNIIDSKKYNKISNEVLKEMNAKGAGASGTVKVGGDEELKEESVTQGNITTETSEFKKGITSEKSVLGSTWLGKWFAGEGTQTGSFLGTSDKSRNTFGKDIDGKDRTSSEHSSQEIFGKRISGGLFGQDKRTLHKGDEELNVTASEYEKMQELVQKKDIEGAAKYFDKLKAQKAEENSKTMADYTGEFENSAENVDVKPVAKKSAETVSKESADNEMIKLKRQQEQAKPSIVNAPTTVNNNTVKNEIKAPIRNQDSSMGRYLDRKYAAMAR